MKRMIELLSLEGRAALVTGGAGHIGSAAAATLTELGARVAVLDRQDALERADTSEHVLIPCDLQSSEQTRSAVRDAISQLGGLDVIVHSAAFVGTTESPGWAVDFESQSAEAWDAAMAVNVRSAFVLAQEARDALCRSGSGSIILISSIYGLVGPDDRLYQGTSMANPMAYGASKAALVQLTRALATRLAPAVRVNALSPGGVLRGQPAQFQQRYCDRVPLGRMATEQDLMGAVAYLASDMSAYVTGHNLVVDGGWTTW